MKASVLAMAVLSLGLVTASCKKGEKPAEAAPQATMTSRGTTTIESAAGVATEDIKVRDECKQVVTCYSALARDLCLNQDENCRSAFEVTTPVNDEKTCERLLDEAKAKAKPFMSNAKNYDMPDECG